jgi:hypothetical protein
MAQTERWTLALGVALFIAIVILLMSFRLMLDIVAVNWMLLKKCNAKIDMLSNQVKMQHNV